MGVHLKQLLDNTLDMALQSYEVEFHLFPLPKPGQNTGASFGVVLNATEYRSGTFFGKVNVLKRTRQRRGSAGKAKREGGKSVLPKLVFGRGSTSMEMRVRRFCFNYHVGECSETSDGGARG